MGRSYTGILKTEELKMTSLKTAASLTVISVVLSGSAAFADVSAEDVWADWRGYMADAGYSVDATESRSGDTLSVTDVVMSIDVPEEDELLGLEQKDAVSARVTRRVDDPDPDPPEIEAVPIPKADRIGSRHKVKTLLDHTPPL